jgi:hypothetical protein
LETQQLETILQLFETHWSRGLEESISIVASYPGQDVQQETLPQQYASQRINCIAGN